MRSVCFLLSIALASGLGWAVPQRAKPQKAKAEQVKTSSIQNLQDNSDAATVNALRLKIDLSRKDILQ